MPTIELPNQWAPRPCQQKLWDYLAGGGKRASVWWHRRLGKDDLALNWTCLAAHMRVGTYWHMCPEKEQVRKAVWDSMNHQGQRRIDQAFPLEIRDRTLENEMKIVLRNGSIINFLGSDRYDANVGTNPIGITFSEWALCDPKAWSYLSPILAAEENKGWALFITTPRGLNHAYDMHTMAESNPKWFAETLTVEETTDSDGKPIISQETIQDERDEGKPEHEIRQEYYCEALADTDYQLIPMQSIVEAVKRDAPPTKLDPGLPTIMGYDVGLSGDPSVRVIRTGRDATTVPLLRIKDRSLTDQAEIIANEMELYKPDRCFIDSTGIGHGLVEMVRQRGYRNVVGVNFGERAFEDQKYANRRAEIYDKLRQWCEQDAPSLENDDLLRRDLSAIRYDPKNARVKIEAKADIKKRTGKSTDEGDALALTFTQNVPRRDSAMRRGQKLTAKISW